MKKSLLLAILFLIPFFGISQTSKSIDSFIGIKFGSNEETVKAAILAKGGKLSAEYSNSNLLEFITVSDGKRNNIGLSVKFYNDMAYEATLIYEVEGSEKIIPYYIRIVNDFNKIYGKGQSSKQFTPPYHDGDGNELKAIETSNAVYHTLWTTSFDRSKIEAFILSKRNIVVKFSHPPL